MKRFVILLCTALPAAQSQADAATQWARVQQAAVSGWQRQAQAMAEVIGTVCNATPEADLGGEQREPLMRAWDNLVRHWGVVATQHPQAIDELGLSYRIAFWPDSRGIVARQMSLHTRERQNGDYRALHLSAQGIQALDWLLAQPQTDCRLALDWAEHYTGYVHAVAEAMPATLTPAERALTLVANDLYAQTSRINQRMREVMANEEARYRPFMGDVSETGKSVLFLQAGLRDLGGRLVAFSQLLPDDGALAEAQDWQIRLTTLADALPEGWPEIPGEAHKLIERIRLETTGVERWLNEDLAKRYSLLIGFNNQDGD